MRTPGRLIGQWLLALAAFGVLLQAVLFARIGALNCLPAGSTSFMRAQAHALARAGEKPAGLEHRWVDYERMSVHIKRAVIAAEDANFAEHAGIDIEAIEKARERNQRRGKVVAGASTITQQLAKNLYLSGERSYARKAQEVIITFMLEIWCSKQRILELYLNSVEWGVGVFGVEAASRHYFSVGADRLTAEQAAWLGSALPNPRFYDKHRAHPHLLWKSGLIQSRMPAAQVP